MDRTVLHFPVAREGQMTIPEKGRKGLRVKLGDKLQHEEESISADAGARHHAQLEFIGVLAHAPV
jgi:bifunctional DNA-binding transcriptional regulator/antitoxin component of YhaV-PrlF toxin-antitoxin module